MEAEARPDCGETEFATLDPLPTEIVSLAVLAHTPVQFAHSDRIVGDSRHLEAVSEWRTARGRWQASISHLWCNRRHGSLEYVRSMPDRMNISLTNIETSSMMPSHGVGVFRVERGREVAGRRVEKARVLDSHAVYTSSMLGEFFESSFQR